MELTLQLGGSGVMLYYYLGVFRAIDLIFGKKNRKNIKIHGISGGAIAACLYVCGVNMWTAKKFLQNRKLKKPFSVRRFPIYIKNILEKLDIGEDSHNKIQNLETYYANASLKLCSVDNESLNNKRNVIDSIVLSGYIFGLCGFNPYKVNKNIMGYDAGIITYYPLTAREALSQENDVISVTPFSIFTCNKTICPRIRLPLTWGLSPKTTKNIEELGFFDTISFFGEGVQIFNNKLKEINEKRTIIENEIKTHITFVDIFFNNLVRFCWLISQRLGIL